AASGSRAQVKREAPASRLLPLQCIQQRLILLRRAYGDAQELVDAWLFEVTHDDALFTQASRQLCRILLRMTGEDEVRRRWQHLETQRGHFSNYGLAAGNDLLTGLLEVLPILERCGGSRNGDAIQRVGVEAVLDPLKRL